MITWFAWRRAEADLRAKFLRIVLPLLALSIVVLISVCNPSTRVLSAAGQPVGLAARNDYLRFLPSTVWPADTIGDFVFKAGLILVGLNILLAKPRRRHQRLLLAGIAANTAVLAFVGSLYNLAGATKILGIVSSPNQHFFASFVYYNHWGGFAVLGAAAAAGLGIDYYRHSCGVPWRDTPALIYAVAALFILLSLPISGARASSAVGAVFVVVVALRLYVSKGPGNRRGLITAIAMAASIALIATMTFFIAGKSADFMARKTAAEFADLQTGGIGDARIPIYKETWKLFLQKPVFGWGWHSYRYAFRRVQTLEFKMQTEQKEMSFFVDAHNDWLQLLAEMGLVGALLVLASVAGVTRVAACRWWRMSPSFEILTGLGCLGMLASVDFPFACPAIFVAASTLVSTAGSIASRRERQAYRSGSSEAGSLAAFTSQ